MDPVVTGRKRKRFTQTLEGIKRRRNLDSDTGQQIPINVTNQIIMTGENHYNDRSISIEKDHTRHNSQHGWKVTEVNIISTIDTNPVHCSGDSSSWTCTAFSEAEIASDMDSTNSISHSNSLQNEQESTETSSPNTVTTETMTDVQ